MPRIKITGNKAFEIMSYLVLFLSASLSRRPNVISFGHILNMKNITLNTGVAKLLKCGLYFVPVFFYKNLILAMGSKKLELYCLAESPELKD